MMLGESITALAMVERDPDGSPDSGRFSPWLPAGTRGMPLEERVPDSKLI